ncbi:zinc finger CCCH domain-containing protein 48-like [Quercus suber]|uniref:zinc finger CCCH domain-containing protein 48-like n=1 Tax=Quercus suber TaxID=58331 RepID=UPI0032DF048B
MGGSNVTKQSTQWNRTSSKMQQALFSSSDGTIRLWDCHTGQCDNVINIGGEVGSVCSEDPWLFVGMPNVVKVWDTESGAKYSLNGPVGQVNALESVYNLLFAGLEDGVILAWKDTYETNITFQLAATLKGHTHGITSLVVGGGNRLYSGSKDHRIIVWDHENWQCIMTLNGHDDVVKFLMCWDKYLFSGSLDCTIKVWASTEDGSLEVIYTHSEEQGILALSGMTDPDVKPILYCSCSDKSVHLYELPT